MTCGQRQIQPRDRAIGQHQRTIVGLDEGAAARGDDDVSDRQQLAERQALQLPEVGSPCWAKMVATVRCSLASIRSSMSSTRQPVRLPSARATVVLPAPMKPTR